MVGGWRKLRNEGLQYLYSSPNTIRIKSRRVRLAEHVARMVANRNVCMVLVGNPERRRPLGKPRRRWEDNIKIYLREVGWGGMDCIDLAQDRDQWTTLVSTIMYFRVP
jgi:hypothetical protein